MYTTKEPNVIWYLLKPKKGMKKYNYIFYSTFYTQYLLKGKNLMSFV